MCLIVISHKGIFDNWEVVIKFWQLNSNAIFEACDSIEKSAVLDRVFTSQIGRSFLYPNTVWP